mgnify:CR=1 FL=1
MDKDLTPQTEILESILRDQRIAQETAKKVFEGRSKRLKQIYDDKIKKSELVVGDIVYYYRPMVRDLSRPAKLQIYQDGPALVMELFPRYSTARIKFLNTNKIHPHLVNVNHLKRAA